MICKGALFGEEKKITLDPWAALFREALILNPWRSEYLFLCEHDISNK